MEFKINVSRFISELAPVVDVATKNTVKDFESAFMISIDATDGELTLISHGGNACIQSKLMNSKIDKLNYECSDEGETVVEAKKLMTSLSSFPPNKDITISVDVDDSVDSDDADGPTGEMQIVCDGTEMQSLPISKNSISMPSLADTFSVELETNREIFIAGMQKVNFSVGIEEYRPKYLCQVFDSSKDGVKFIAGNGARFAIDEITGKGISSVAKKQRIIFPKNNISNLLNSLKTSSSEKIMIKEGEATKNNSDQIIVEFDDSVFVILGIDANIKDKYADVDRILEYNHPYQFKVDIKEWVYPTKGTRATYSDEMKTDSLVHNAEIEVDTKKEKFIVKSDTNMKSKRTVKVETLSAGDDKKVLLRCNSLFLAEMVSQGYDSGNITMRFIDQDKPIVVDYPELKDGIRDTTEKYSIFFTTSKKK
jgi:hypothetical protein